MPHIETEWDNDGKTAMRVTYREGWSWKDMQDNLPIEKNFLDSVNHRVDVIADFRGTRLPPGAITQLPKIANSPPYIHPNSGLMVMVGSPNFMEEVVNIYRRVYGQKTVKLHMVADLEAARKMIAEDRAKATAPKPVEVKPEEIETEEIKPADNPAFKASAPADSPAADHPADSPASSPVSNPAGTPAENPVKSPTENTAENPPEAPKTI